MTPAGPGFADALVASYTSNPGDVCYRGCVIDLFMPYVPASIPRHHRDTAVLIIVSGSAAFTTHSGPSASHHMHAKYFPAFTWPLLLTLHYCLLVHSDTD